MSNSDFFIDRPATDDLLQGLKQALQTPANSPVVFQAYGIGGIGKSTLTKKIQKYLPEAKVIVIEVTAVGLEEPRAPLTLMNKIYQSLPSFNDDWREEFPDWYKKYEETRQLVERDDQGKTLIKGTQNLAQAFLPKPIGEAVKHGAQAVLDAPDKMEQFEGFLAKFAPTKGQSEEAQALKKLMLKPYEVLTGYFVKAVQARLRQQPVVMVLDVYEKVGQDVDQWLLRYLLQEYDLQGQQFRVVITGRNPLRDRDGWHDLAKNRNGYIREIEIPVFDRKQTQQFLDHYKIQGFEKIFELTKGWPYYLNKIAQQAQLPGGLNLLRIEGIDLEEDLSRLLLGEQVTEELKKLVNLAACCRQFNRELLEILWRHFYPEGWTEELWADLQGRSFVLGLGRYWQFDDVSRDIFRKVLFNNRPDHFEAVNAKLQGYFQEQSAKYIPDEDAWPQKYGDLDWLRERTNALYYGFFLKRPDFTGFIAHLLEAVHFNCGEQVIAVMEWIEAETPAARHAQLSDGCKKFLNVMEPLTSFIGLWLLQDPAMVTESAEQEALNTVWRYAKKSLGLAKFTALHLQSGHEQQSVAKELLLEARKLADDLVVDDDPEFSSGLFLWELGNKFHENESYEEAIASYDRTIFFKHDYHEAWSNRGISLDNLGRYEDAIASYDRAISFKHDKHEAWSNRGVSLGNLGRYEEAIASYDRAISFKHDKHEAWSNRGVSLDNLGRYEEAIASYDRAISFKHDKHEAWSNRGVSLGNLGRDEEAIASYDRAISFKHDLHEAWSNRGNSLRNLGRYEEAIASYDRAISFKHDLHEAWSNRGVSLDNLGRYEEAIESYDRAISFKHDLHEAWSNRGNSLDNLGRYEEAIESHDRAISFKHDKHEAWYNRGIALDNLGRYEEAIESYDRAISFKHDLHEAWSNRGNSLDNLGRYEEAIASYDRAISFKHDKHEAWYNRGNSLGNLGRDEEAIESYDRAISFKHDKHEAWGGRAIALRKLGRYSEAFDSYDQAIAIQPHEPQYFHNKGCAYFKQSRYPESINCFNQAIAIKFDKYDSWHDKGLVHFVLSDYLATIDSWQQAFKYISDPAVPRYYEDISGLIQEFIEELIPRFTQPSIHQTLLIPLLEIYQQANVITELGTALVNTLHLIVAPTISDHTAAEWLSLWRTSSLGNESAMELPLRLMSTAIEYKKDPSQRDLLWLNLPSEEQSILNKALKLAD